MPLLVQAIEDNRSLLANNSAMAEEYQVHVLGLAEKSRDSDLDYVLPRSSIQVNVFSKDAVAFKMQIDEADCEEEMEVNANSLYGFK